MANEKRLIDANALMEQFDDCNFKGFVMKRLIEMQPTVDAVEVVHGRWKIEWLHERDPITSECDEYPMAICPFCGHEECGFAYDDYWGKPYNYCPNCGAKMDGDGNG